jgi:DNA-binding transcriptional LysR family regulator
MIGNLAQLSASIRHLKVFENVGQLRGVRRASEECHLSQPAVSQAIAKLEQHVGAVLLHRCASGSYLNEFGVIFHRRTQRFFVQLEQALLELGVPASPTPVGRLAARISWPQLRTLVAIVENGSFAHAARALSTSQISLQRSARDLERALRVPLYEQTASGIVATPAAADFANKIKLAQREIDLGVQEVAAALGDNGGEIVIGAMLLAGSVVLATVVNDFASVYPNAHIRILNGNTEEMIRCLRTGDVDFVIGLLREAQADGLVQKAFVQTPYVICGREGHPLSNKQHVTLDELAEFDWVIGTVGASRRLRFESLFAGRRGPNARIETCSLPTVRLLLRSSDRLTMLTSYELMHEDDTLVAVPFGPIEPAPSLGLIMRENWLPTQLQTAFIDLVQKRTAGLLDPTGQLQRLQEKESVHFRKDSQSSTSVSPAD